MSENKFEDGRETAEAGVGNTEPLPAQETGDTRSFEADEAATATVPQTPDETRKLEAEAAAFVADQRAAELAEADAKAAAEAAAQAKAQAEARAKAQPEAPTFRPENESEEGGFVGYITSKRGPQTPPHQGQAWQDQPNQNQATPPVAAPTSPLLPPVGHPGIRVSTVIIGLLLLAVGLSALAGQLGGVTFNPAAVALAVMLGAGVTLMSAAIRRVQRSKS
jgi:hypothetical protein